MSERRCQSSAGALTSGEVGASLESASPEYLRDVVRSAHAFVQMLGLHTAAEAAMDDETVERLDVLRLSLYPLRDMLPKVPA